VECGQRWRAADISIDIYYLSLDSLTEVNHGVSAEIVQYESLSRAQHY
jgi:hypothetical protein